MHLAKRASDDDLLRLHFYRIFRWMARIGIRNGEHLWANGIRKIILKRVHTIQLEMGPLAYRYQKSYRMTLKTISWKIIGPVANGRAENQQSAQWNRVQTEHPKVPIQTVWKCGVFKHQFETGEMNSEKNFIFIFYLFFRFYFFFSFFILLNKIRVQQNDVLKLTIFWRKIYWKNIFD